MFYKFLLAESKLVTQCVTKETQCVMKETRRVTKETHRVTYNKK
ncbi:MAG: hypothetical protein PHU66_04635 [Bacteroidaceae bacterium]|nr:hypothetical protein [Bacteroidaceae bacterium]